MLKRIGADAEVAGVAGSAVLTEEKAPTWSSPGKSNRSPLVPCVQYSRCYHLKQVDSTTDMKQTVDIFITLKITSGDLSK